MENSIIDILKLSPCIKIPCKHFTYLRSADYQYFVTEDETIRIAVDDTTSGNPLVDEWLERNHYILKSQKNFTKNNLNN